jgi:hypothetical protein
MQMMLPKHNAQTVFAKQNMYSFVFGSECVPLNLKHYLMYTFHNIDEVGLTQWLHTLALQIATNVFMAIA